MIYYITSEKSKLNPLKSFWIINFLNSDYKLKLRNKNRVEINNKYNFAQEDHYIWFYIKDIEYFKSKL